MHGIGELFGSAFDDVLRRPAPALVPAVVDVALLLGGAVVVAAATGALLPVQAPQGLPAMPVAVPEALPSVADLRDPTASALDLGPRAWLALAAFTALALPVAAFARAGFVGVLAEAYLPRRDDPMPVEPPSLARLADAFRASARRGFGPLLVIGVVEAAVAVAALVLPREVPYFRNSLLGLVTVDFLLIFAPYAAVVRGLGAWRAMRESVRTVSDFLASSLVALLFGLLTTGGFAALLKPLVAALGAWGLLAGAVLYAPVGTVLALFYLKVYLSLHPGERLPLAARDAPAKTTMPSDA